MSVTLAALAALGSLAATGYGAYESAKANKEARGRLEADREEDRRYYDRLLNRDYVNSSENQSLLRRLQEIQRKNYERARAINTVAGGTDASLAAMQQAGNDVVAQTAQGIAAGADAYKDRVSQAKRASEKAYANQMFALDQQKAQTIAQAAGQATSAMAGIAGAAGSVENPFGTATEDVAPTFGEINGGMQAIGAIDPTSPQYQAIVNQNQVVANPSRLAGYEQWKNRMFGLK